MGLVGNLEIGNIPKVQWKIFFSSYIKDLTLEYLIEENSTQKTRYSTFEILEMRDNLVQNRITALSKVIFSVRSGTLDIKHGKNENMKNLLVLCVTQVKKISKRHVLIGHMETNY